MHQLLRSVILLGLWAVQGSHGRFLSDPTQRPQIQNFHQPPEPTAAPGLRHEAKRQQMSMSELAVTQAPDETCGYLSGRAVLPITCENSKPCMWATEMGIMICGDIKDDEDNWQIHIRCMDREMALNPALCNDTCIHNPVFLRCTDESAPYCATYLFPDDIVDYRCSSTQATRASSADFTYRGQENAGIVTTIIPLNGRRITTTKPTESISSADSTSSTASAPPSASPDPPSSNNLGAIIGGAIGGFAALSLVILAIFWFIRQSRKKQHPPPTQVSQMEQAPLSDSMAGKPVPTSPVQSEWRGSMMTAFSSPHSTSPQGWLNQPVSPSAHSEMSQGILPPMGSNLPHEMSGESVPRQAHEMGDSRVYEMEGDPNHRWA